MRALLMFAIVASPVLAHAGPEVFPTALPPMFYVDDAATVSASITTDKRAINAQYDAAEQNLFEIGGGAVIDDVTNTYSLQIHMGLGKRFQVHEREIMGTGHLRVCFDARVLAETIFTQPGKDDEYGFRLAADGGVGAWAVTPKGVHLGAHLGFEAGIADPVNRPAEIVVAAMVGMPYGEPDPHAAQTEALAVDKMLTTDPASWPEDAYVSGAAVDHDVTVVSIGVVYARPIDTMPAGGTMTFDQRLMLAVGVLYP